MLVKVQGKLNQGFYNIHEHDPLQMWSYALIVSGSGSASGGFWTDLAESKANRIWLSRVSPTIIVAYTPSLAPDIQALAAIVLDPRNGCQPQALDNLFRSLVAAACM